MNLKNIDLENMIKIMKKNDVSEIDLKNGLTTISIKMKGSDFLQPVTRYIEKPEKQVKEIVTNENIEKPKLPKTETKYHQINSPLVGTFYRASGADAKPFVEIGDRIKKGDTLCIVEAMKSMNEIESEVSGIIKDICVENAKPIELDQLLFLVDVSK